MSWPRCFAKYALGVDIEIEAESRGWESFERGLLDAQRFFVQSLWNLHAQPPILNLVGAILAKLFTWTTCEGDGHSWMRWAR